MTPVVFDDRTGRLRLDQATFEQLVAWARARGDGDPGPGLAALREAGAVRPGAPHPALAPGLLAVTEPVCRLRLRLTDELGRARSGEGWVRGDAASLLLDLPDGLRDFVTLAPAFLPAALARVVRLGPRPRPPSQPVQVPAALLGTLFSADAAERAGVAELVTGVALRAAVKRLAAGPWRVWRAEMTWTGPGGRPARRELHVADGEVGLLLLDVDDERAVLWPTTPTAVWRHLIRLLPDTVELARDE